MSLTQSIVDFILDLLGNPEKAEQFDRDPQKCMADAGLSHVQPADVQQVIPQVVAQVGGGGNWHPDAGGGTAAQMITTIVNKYYKEINIHVEGHDNKVNVNTGDGAVLIDGDNTGTVGTGDGVTGTGNSVGNESKSTDVHKDESVHGDGSGNDTRTANDDRSRNDGHGTTTTGTQPGAQPAGGTPPTTPTPVAPTSPVVPPATAPVPAAPVAPAAATAAPTAAVPIVVGADAAPVVPILSNLTAAHTASPLDAAVLGGAPATPGPVAPEHGASPTHFGGGSIPVPDTPSAPVLPAGPEYDTRIVPDGTELPSSGGTPSGVVTIPGTPTHPDVLGLTDHGESSVFIDHLVDTSGAAAGHTAPVHETVVSSDALTAPATTHIAPTYEH